MRYARVSDLIRLSLLMQGTAEGVSLSDIMAEFEVSRRTAERMRSALLDALPQIEVRGDAGGEKRWRLPPRCLGGMTQPTLHEIAALHRARDLAAREGDSATGDALTGLAARLQAALPAPTRTRLEPDIAALLEADGVALRPGPREVIAPDILQTLRQAIMAGVWVNVDHRARGSGKLSRDVWLGPLALLLGEGRQYLVAWSEYQEDVRLFALAGFERVELGDEAFERPEGFDLQAYLAQSFGVFQEEVQDVVWRFTPEAAPEARRFRFHPSQELEDALDGSLIVRFRAGGMLEMCWHLFRWGDQVEVLEGVLYVQRDDFPSVAKSHLRLLDLPSRRNAKQVMARFGVSTLQKDALNLRLCSVDEVVEGDSITLRSRFDLSKPYIAALRKALSPDGTHLRRLEAVQLKVASHAEIELSINGTTIVEKLDPWRHSFDGDTLVITVDGTRSFEEVMDLGCHAVADGLAELFELQSGADFMPFLASSTDALRRAHLQRALPSFSEEELASLIGGVDHAFVSPFAPDVDAETLAAGPAAAANKSRDRLASSAADSGNDELGPDPDEAPSGAKPSEVELTVQQRQPQNNTSLERAPFPRRTLRVSGPTGHVPSPNATDPHRAADAEHWTAAFERANGRWPQLVAHLQGTRAFGCDYLTFDSEEDRSAFLKNPTRIELVSRFIETKSGSVRFSDNEWLAANNLGERYFIYRISFSEGGRDQAQLTVVRNPSARGEAIRTERELLVDKVNGREEFDLIVAEPLVEEQPEAHVVATNHT